MWSAETAHKKIDEFATLEPDWDSYGANVISQVAITKAHELIDLRPDSIMFAAPLPDGGITVEWAHVGRGIEVDIDADGELSVLLIIKTYHEETVTTQEDVLKLIDFSMRGTRRKKVKAS